MRHTSMWTSLSFVAFALRSSNAIETIASTERLSSAWHKDVNCHSKAPSVEVVEGCVPSKCGRTIVDGLFEDQEIEQLLSIVERGLALRDKASQAGGGPAIFDLNTGFVRDSNGLDNVFAEKHNSLFTPADFYAYGRIIKKLKQHTMESLGVNHLFFTAPTFVTRLDGRNPDWAPRAIHDEYWHLHVDQNSTSHYFYSGLLYLNSYKTNFEGGLLRFYNKDEETVEEIVEPRRGRALFFTAGPENPHSVDRVTSGLRYVLSFWFTCDPKREFQIFLDGQAHMTFGKQVIARLERQRQEGQVKARPKSSKAQDL